MSVYLRVEILTAVVDCKLKFVVIEEEVTSEDDNGMTWMLIPESIQHNIARGNSFSTFDDAKAYIVKLKATKH